MEKEIWKDIKGYEGFYQVSNLGRVRGLDRVVNHGSHNTTRKIKGRIIKAGNNGTGYLFSPLQKDGKVKQVCVHRLVAQAFIPNPKNKPQVNHKDKVRDNNKSSNLEWCTVRENICYSGLNIKKTSKYTGVCWHKFSKSWRAAIDINGKRIELGNYKTEELAKEAYQHKFSKHKLKNKYNIK